MIIHIYLLWYTYLSLLSTYIYTYIWYIHCICIPYMVLLIIADYWLTTDCVTYLCDYSDYPVFYSLTDWEDLSFIDFEDPQLFEQ